MHSIGVRGDGSSSRPQAILSCFFRRNFLIFKSKRGMKRDSQA